MKTTTQALLGAALVALAPLAQAEEVRFALANYRIANGKQLSSVNPRLLEGFDELAIGTKVKVLEVDGRKVRMERLDNGKPFWFVNHKSSLESDSNVVVGWFFGTDDPMPKVLALSSSERKHVLSGTIDKGMSKDAVLFAIGPPPKHKTPNLTQNRWTYWRAGSDTFQLGFDERGLLSDLPGEDAAAEGAAPAKQAPEGGAPASDPTVQDFRYAASNYHVQKGGKLFHQNYVSGEREIPFNTKVMVTKRESEEITFRAVESGKEYRFQNAPKKSRVATAELFDQWFPADDQSKQLRKLTADERQDVEAWRVRPGMSKLAARLAVGPPGVGDTAADDWNYQFYHGWGVYTGARVEFNAQGKVSDILH